MKVSPGSTPLPKRFGNLAEALAERGRVADGRTGESDGLGKLLEDILKATGNLSKRLSLHARGSRICKTLAKKSARWNPVQGWRTKFT